MISKIIIENMKDKNFLTHPNIVKQNPLFIGYEMIMLC